MPAGMNTAESLTPISRLILLSARSPRVPSTAAATPNARDNSTPNDVTGMNRHDMRHDAKTEPAMPSQLLPGEIDGQIL